MVDYMDTALPTAPLTVPRPVALPRVESPASRGAGIRVRGVSRRFEGSDGPVEALRSVDLSVAAGEFCVIVGPSGCGKTTLLRMIAGLEDPTSGVISLHRADERPTSNAMVFQGRSVFPWLRVRDNVTYGLKLQGVGRARRDVRAAELLNMVGLTRFARSFPYQLSEGMRQRVAIARALAVDPDVLLMDEPFGALDEQNRLLLQEELLRIWEDTGKTVVFVTHSIDEAIVLADRIVVMSAVPGTIKATIRVPFARPRRLAEVRSDAAFAPLFTEIWELLRSEVLQSRRELSAEAR
ncbi:MAG: ABC transporter ATP-binding protein [Chloroflexota bacterium]|nr:ABC transporter ATP-binding protein [Chloroflexota bacterium]